LRATVILGIKGSLVGGFGSEAPEGIGEGVERIKADIRAMVDATDASTIGIRDRPLILLGFAGAFRRSDIPPV
jgi:hypothetical protein